MSLHLVAPSGDLAHCHRSPVTPPSGSVSVAVISTPCTSGCWDDRLKDPVSSLLVTLIVTFLASSRDPLEACTITLYTLSESESVGASKLGDDLKLSTPFDSAKRLASAPDRLHLAPRESGPAAL